MPGLGPVVSVLWKELGLAPPPGQIGDRFDFELGEMHVELGLQDNGETVLLRGRIGWLEGNIHEAGDQLHRVQRLGLGLVALNGAALDASEAEDILERDHEGPVPVFAVAVARLSSPGTILPALRAVLDWQAVTETILSQSGDGSAPVVGPRGSDDRGSDADMIIFQP